MSCARLGAAVAACAFFQLTAPAAFAQPAVVPPKIEVALGPDDPASDADVTVELELTVTAAGDVRDVKVVSPPQARWDEAAVAAMSRARATPATRDGAPAAARVRYALTFPAKAAPPPPPPPPEEPPPSPPDPPAPPPDAPPPPDRDEATFGARAVTEAPPREVTTRSLGATELRMLGTRGDPLRAVELLPGFARSPFGNPNPIIRGSTGNESQVFFEGAPVPLLYHFGGITSFVPGRFIERVDFYPGNFSARYGRVLGGVVDVRTREPKGDGLHGALDASFVDASVAAEGPLAGRSKSDEPEPERRVTAAVGARRSYVDFYLGQVLPDDLVKIQTAPVYYDYQGLVSARLSREHALRVWLYGSEDRFAVLFDKPADQDPAFRGRLDLRTAFHRAQATLQSRLSERVTQEATLSVGAEKYRQSAGAVVGFEAHSTAIRSRLEWTFRPFAGARLVAGVDHASQSWTGTYEGIRPTGEGATTAAVSVLPRASSLSTDAWTHAPAAYVEGAFLLGDRVTVMPSARVDYLDTNKSLTFDPRLAARARITDTTTLKGGVGRFTQHPQFYELLPDIGNPNLENGYAVHYSAGAEQLVGDSVKLGLEGFTKSLHHLLSYVPDGRAPYIDNQGRGRVYGLEAEARVLPKGRVYGLVAYTLSRSLRGRSGEALRLFENDQTHVGSAAVVVRLGKGWEAAATFRLTSANPRTPVVGSVYDTRTDTYSARYGGLLSDRGPLYHRLDLHLEKKWTFTAWSLTAYADVQNVYNAANREYVDYNYDFTKQAGAASFPPILPSLGVRGEL